MTPLRSSPIFRLRLENLAVDSTMKDHDDDKDDSKILDYYTIGNFSKAQGIVKDGKLTMKKKTEKQKVMETSERS